MDLYYERGGEGPGLLLVHGLGGSAAIWHPVRARLEREREVVAVDLPGFGRSPAFDDGIPATAAAMATEVIALCERIGLARPDVAGNSLGAWVALEMAKRDAVASVCGISPAGLWRNALGPRQVERQPLGRRLRPLVGLVSRSRRARIAMLRSTMAHPERVPPEDARALMLAYVSSRGYVSANREMRATPFEHEGRVEVPVTLAWGERDRLVGPPRPERAPPGATLLRMAGWGHTPTWDDPEGVARLILDGASPGGESGPR